VVQFKNINQLWTSSLTKTSKARIDRKKNLTKLNAAVPRSDLMQKIQNIKKKKRRE
jgi:hypothetical protein